MSQLVDRRLSGKNRSAVGDQESTTSFGCFLEANKCSVGSSSLRCRLGVQTNVVATERRLVHLQMQRNRC